MHTTAQTSCPSHLFFLLQISRLLSCAYCSALLQAITAATEDLQMMYNAQLSCIQEAHPEKGECVWLMILLQLLLVYLSFFNSRS